MNFLTEQIKHQIQNKLVENFKSGTYPQGVQHVRAVLDSIYDAIPEKKRISYGRYTTIKVLAEYLHNALVAAGLPVVEIGVTILNATDDVRTMGVGLGILSLYGLKDFKTILPYFERAAQSEDWELREYAQGLFRKVVKAHPAEVRPYLIEYVQSDEPNLRRFVSEMLRPVVENKWLQKDQEYSLSILRHLFREPHPYPRTSVGNHLSDIARRDPEMVLGLVRELAVMGDRQAFWIADRACRNLVKSHPLEVMDALGVEEYKYKGRIYKRGDYL